VLIYIAYYFSSAGMDHLSGANANDPLALLASILGVAMGALQPGLSRQCPPIARVNLVILLVWIALVPLIPFIETSWLGAYERCVGSLMLCWTALLALLPPAGVLAGRASPP
jgi:hypothetical protein